jgi:hypothetical protein
MFYACIQEPEKDNILAAEMESIRCLAGES